MGGLSRFKITSTETTMTQRQRQTLAALKRCQRFFNAHSDIRSVLRLEPAMTDLGTIVQLIELCATSERPGVRHALRCFVYDGRIVQRHLTRLVWPLIWRDRELVALWTREKPLKREVHRATPES